MILLESKVLLKLSAHLFKRNHVFIDYAAVGKVSDTPVSKTCVPNNVFQCRWIDEKGIRWGKWIGCGGCFHRNHQELYTLNHRKPLMPNEASRGIWEGISFTHLIHQYTRGIYTKALSSFRVFCVENT
jgi:hypothetical protein